jgi:hypothetical protein
VPLLLSSGVVWGAAATEGEKCIVIEVTRIQSVWEKQTRDQQCAINLVSGPRQGVKAVCPSVRGRMKKPDAAVGGRRTEDNA